jgi:hypothetical protein
MKLTDEAKRWPFLTIRNELRESDACFRGQRAGKLIGAELKAKARCLLPDRAALGHHKLMSVVFREDPGVATVASQELRRERRRFGS